MNKKGKLITLVLLSLMTIGAYAQNVSLREGYYQTQGSAAHIYIIPNRELSNQGNTPQNAFNHRTGSYGILMWAGMPESVNLLYGGTGNIVGDEFRINIQRFHSTNINAAGLARVIAPGTLTIWSVINNETFLDAIGQRWVWRRQR